MKPLAPTLLLLLSLALAPYARTAVAAPAAADEGAAVTYDDVTAMLKAGEDEAVVLEKIEKSPVVFTLDAKQVAELTKLGASPKVLAAMKSVRGGGSPSGAAAEAANLAILFDCSASMQEKTEDGQTKMVVARKAVQDLVKKIPEGVWVTFVLYGHDRLKGCDAVEVHRKLGPLDSAAKAELIQFIGTLQPAGNTPFALAIRTAGKEVTKNNAPCGLVVFSDGKESCKGDPAREAALLAKNPNLSFGVSVIGIGIPPEDRAAVEAVAKAGKGQYLSADSAAELAMAVQKVDAETVAPAAAASAKAAPPASSVTGRRAIRVLEPEIDLPAMKSIVLSAKGGFPPGHGSHAAVATVTKYGQDLRLPSEAAFDVWWVPADGLPVKMMDGFSIKERKRVDVKPEELLGLVQVNGEGLPKPKLVGLVAVGGFGLGHGSCQPVQLAQKYGVPMVVPKGSYDLWTLPADGAGEKLEEKLEVKPGELTVIE